MSWRRSAPCCGVRSRVAIRDMTRWCGFRNCCAAPGMIAIIWSGLFDRFEPLDIRAMLRAHFEIIFGLGAVA